MLAAGDGAIGRLDLEATTRGWSPVDEASAVAELGAASLRDRQMARVCPIGPNGTGLRLDDADDVVGRLEDRPPRVDLAGVEDLVLERMGDDARDGSGDD